MQFTEFLDKAATRYQADGKGKRPGLVFSLANGLLMSNERLDKAIKRVGVEANNAGLKVSDFEIRRQYFEIAARRTSTATQQQHTEGVTQS